MTAGSFSAERVLAGTFAELAAARCLLARLSADVLGRPREAIVVLDHGDVPRAYLNLCQHIPIPLDAGSRQFIVHGALQCATHGARYRLNDGLCIVGPCRGASLVGLQVEIVTALVFVIDAPAP